jgi:hypothetical protein
MSLMLSALLDALREAVGANHVVTEPDLVASHVVDWTGRFRGATPAVVRPGSVEEVAAVVRACATAGAAIVPQGGNTGLVGGSIPRHGEIVCHLGRLNALGPVDGRRGQVSAQAGVTIGRLQEHARAAGWEYGVDLGARDSATVGGTIATNAGGVHVLRHGATRAQLLGIEAVLGDGSVVRRLDGLEKDNTGYDLAGLVCGSEGTLAIVTAARLRLVARPAHVVVALCAFADVDAALRARIKEFYDLHVNGQFRKADELVAEDTKEYYFNGRKPQYLSYEISRIDYSDNFTKAKAVILCEMYIMLPGFLDKPVKMPTPSAWKIENGKWFWWVDQKELRNTPFGTMVAGPAVRPGQAAPPPAAGLPHVDMSADFLFKQVQVDKDQVELSAGDSAEVTIANTAPGAMDISVVSSPEGVAAKLGKTSLNANEKTVLKITAGKDVRPGAVQIRVEPIGQLIPIQIRVK